MTENITKISIILIPVTGLSYFINIEWYRYLIQEDGIYENLTALLMLVMCFSLLYKVFKSKNQTKKWLFYNILLALLFFFGFGEEISWGQRIFSIEAGEYFSENNLQNETNLHNLKINGVKINKLIFSYGIGVFIFVYFFITPYIYTKFTKFKALVDNFGIHIPKYSQIVLFIIATLIIITIPSGKKWELLEVVFILVYYLTLIAPLNTKENLYTIPKLKS